MSGVLGGGKTKAPAYTGLQLNRSAYGQAVPLVYGQTRIAPNVIWYENFTLHQNQGGGKGGGNTGSNSYTYYVDIALGLCEGPVAGIGTVWQNGDNNVTNLATLVMGFAAGAYGQATWSYLASNFPNQAVPYSGLAYTRQNGYNLGNTSSLPNWGFEIQGLLYGTAPNGIDADPSQVITDMLSDPGHGAGFPASRIGQINVVSETHTVPGGGHTVTPTANFVYNLCVVDGSGNVYQSVATGITPGAFQYSIAGNTYTFGAASAGQSLTFRFASNQGLYAYRGYALASGLWVSPAYESQTAAASLLTDLATYTNSAFVWSAGSLCLQPYASVTVTGNGFTFNAPGAPLFSLSDDDFQQNQAAAGNSSSNGPVVLSRTRPADQYNDIQIEVRDRGNQYAATVIEITDAANMTLYGRRNQGTQQAHIFADPQAGHTSAQLLLQRQFVRNNYAFTLDQRYCVLDPMDIVSITDANLGLFNQWVRITDITENDDGTLSVLAEEYPTGTGAGAIYTVNTGQAKPFNQSDLAPQINPPIIFTPPIALCASNGLEVWAAISGLQSTGNTTSTYGGCYVWLSYDGTEFTEVLNFTAISRMGVTTSSLALHADPDAADSVGIDLSQSLGALTSVSASVANGLGTLSYLDGEYIAFQNATLTGSYQYTLGTLLRRGLYGSAPAAHAASTQFCRLDSNIAKIQINQAKVGQTIYVIFQPYNAYGGGTQALSSLTVYNISVGGAPNNFVPTSINATASLKSVSISWVNPVDAETALKAVEVWRNTTNTLGTATHIGDAAYPGQTFVDSGLTSSTTYFYWLRCRDLSGTYGPWTTAISATPTTLGTVDLSPGSVTAATFVNGITPVGSGTLPSPTGYTGPPVWLNSADGQLYRYVSGAWTLAAPATNITGTISLGNIPSIPTTQLSGFVQAAQIQTNSLGATQISSSYTYTGVLSASQITTGTLSASFIAAGTFTGFTIQTASSGARFVMSPGVFLSGYNSSNVLTVSCSPNFLAGNASLQISDSSGTAMASLGAGGASIFGAVTGLSANTVACRLFGSNSSSDALLCSLGGITITSGYLAMGGGNITGLGTSLTSTASTLFITAGTNATFVANILPNSDNHYTAGNSSFRFSTVYSAGGVVTTSDERLKDFEQETLGLDFIKRLNPISGKWKTDGADDPIHHWLSAQDVEAALQGASFAGLIKPEEGPVPDEGMGEPCLVDGKTPYGLNYDEFVGPSVVAMKELDAKDADLQAQITSLKAMVEALQSQLSTQH